MTDTGVPTEEATAFVRALFEVPDEVDLPLGATFHIKAEMELYPNRGYENWKPIPGREADIWRNDDEDPEPSDWCGEDQYVHPVGVTHYHTTIDEVYVWAKENGLEDPDGWSTDNGGMLMGDGLHLAAMTEDVDPMDWNVGGVTSVFVADVWIAAE